MAQRRNKEFVTIRKEGKLVTVPVEEANRMAGYAVVPETALDFARNRTVERTVEVQLEDEQAQEQFATQGGGPIWTNPAGECWKDQNEMQDEISDLMSEARNYPAPAMLTCNHLTYNTPLGTQIYVLDPICEQAARRAWYDCKTTAMIDLQIALQKAFTRYYTQPERKAADRELEEDNSQVEERCERIYQAALLASQPAGLAGILAAKSAYMACIAVGYRQARAEWCSHWDQSMDDWVETQFIGAMTGFYNDMLICDNTYRNTNCCVGQDN